MAREDGFFDELTRDLARGTPSRGKALRLMGAALLGGALASFPGIAEAAPPPKPPGRKCKLDSQCAFQLCLNGVCSGVPNRCRSCPEDCRCVVLADGSIGCWSCPDGLCAAQEVHSSCGECGTNEVCAPLAPGEFMCLPPCTVG